MMFAVTQQQTEQNQYKEGKAGIKVQTGKWNKWTSPSPAFSGGPRIASDEQAVRLRHLPQDERRLVFDLFS